MSLPDKIERIKVADLVPYARNARTHSDDQIALLCRSIQEFGFTNPVLIDNDGGIVAGHGRVMAAQKLAMDVVPCLRVGWLTEAQKKAYVLADNKMAMHSGWDKELLAQEMRELQAGGFDLTLTGFAEEEFVSLTFDPAEGGGIQDDAPAVQDNAVSKSGDLWLLGSHRVLCGDSTNRADVDRLIDGSPVQLIWTDPPYNVAYGGKAEMLDRYDKAHRNTDRILNDDMSDVDFAKFMLSIMQNAYHAVVPGGAIYVAHAETEGINFRQSFVHAGFKLSACLIWKKNALVLGRSDYQWMHEPILYGWKPGASHRWFGGRKQVSLTQLGEGSPFTKLADGRWQITIGDQVLVVDGQASVEEMVSTILSEDKPKRSELHPTMKPVALIERMLRCSGRPGDAVLDLFGGSGSTLIAAERLGMRARLIEMAPTYVDVIVRRWQQYTGQRATHAVTGKPFPTEA